MSISQDLFATLQQRIGYQFKDTQLLQLALTHRSYGKPNNERLEFLGDSILGALVTEILFKDNASVQEGELTQRRSSLVNGKNLSKIARELSLDQVMLLGLGENRDQIGDAILEDALEALVGAVFVDSDFNCCRETFRPLFENELVQVLSSGQGKDSKTKLQELMQAQKSSLPRYRLEQTEGPDHDKRFLVRVEIEKPALQAKGEGSSRKNAEQQAACNLLDMLGEEYQGS